MEFTFCQLRRLLTVAVLLGSTAAFCADRPFRVTAGTLIVKAFDEHRIFAVIDAPEKSRGGADGIVDHLFLYQTRESVPAFDIPITPGRVIETDQGLIVVAPTEKIALILSLDLQADTGLDFGFLDQGYTVIRVAAGNGYKQVEGTRMPMGPLLDATADSLGSGTCCEPVYSDWGLGGGGGGSGGCPAGGGGATSCSYSCGGMQCNVTCSGERIPCCGCTSSGVPTCRCL